MTRIIISPPPPLVFLFCKIDEITKLDDEQKKPIVKLHWCVTSDTSYDKIKKTLSYNTKIGFYSLP